MTTAVTKSGRAIRRRRVAKGESNPTPLFPDDNSSFSKIVEVDKYTMPFLFIEDGLGNSLIL
jgi:hypothetical protein